MKQIIVPLFFLIALCTGTEISSRNTEAAENFLNFFRYTDTVSKEALKFLDNVFVEMAKYRCDVGGDDCAALTVATEEVKMAIDNASLQNNKFNRLNIARIYEASVELVNDFGLINGIRHAVIQYICVKEPEACPTLTAYESEVADALEHEIKPKN